MGTVAWLPGPDETDQVVRERLDVGDTRIDALTDIEVRMALGAVFARKAPPVPMAELAARYPREFTAEAWRFRVRVFLIRSGSMTVLVDAGSGPIDTAMGASIPAEGTLLRHLTALDVALSEVDHVVLTHAHDDHVGWATVMGEAGPRPTFKNATYHLHPADLELARGVASSYWARTFGPLEASGQLSLTPSPTELAEGIEIVETPGHTPGHRCVQVRSPYRTVLFTGDLLHFGFQLEDPSADGPFDSTVGAGTQARVAAMTERSADDRSELVLASAHLPDPFIVLPGVQAGHA